MPFTSGSSLQWQLSSSRHRLRFLSSYFEHKLVFSSGWGSAKINCSISRVRQPMMYSSNWHCGIPISFKWDWLFCSYWSSCFRGNLWSLVFVALVIGRAIAQGWFFFLSSRYLPYQILLYDILSLWLACYFLSGFCQACSLSDLLSCVSLYAFYERSCEDTCSIGG